MIDLSLEWIITFFFFKICMKVHNIQLDLQKCTKENGESEQKILPSSYEGLSLECLCSRWQEFMLPGVLMSAGNSSLTLDSSLSCPCPSTFFVFWLNSEDDTSVSVGIFYRMQYKVVKGKHLYL